MKEQTQEIVSDLASSFQDIFADAFMNLEHGFQGFFDSVLTGFQRLLSEIAAQFLASQVMRWMVGQMGGSVDFLSGLIGKASNAATVVSTGFTGQTGEILPGNAVGGVVRKGLAYIVGERGPELFVPNQSGSIQGNLAAAGGGGTTVIMNVYAKDYASFRPNQGQMIADAIRQADLARRRNGQADVR
jgi:phage-related minor tail protein